MAMLVFLSIIYLLTCPQHTSQSTQITIRLTRRQWDIPLDTKVGTAITYIHIAQPDKSQSNITASFGKVTNNYGPLHDASEYFGLNPLKSDKGDNKFEAFLKKPLLGKFQAGDQFNLVVQAFNGPIISKMEVYGRIKEALDASLVPSDLTTSSTTTTTTSARPILSNTASISELSSQNTPIFIRLEKRQWDIPIDTRVGTAITRIHMVQSDTSQSNITASFGKVTTNYGPFHDASEIFGLTPLKSDNGDKKFEAFLNFCHQLNTVPILVS
eukprot:GFUD01083242.1.p1 GENE.GFUD01083242.1~~GFUD01083242.1.p1  ORF type:complete len:285 (+),score=20.82 GFUD01083242.1:47-856(+)